MSRTWVVKCLHCSCVRRLPDLADLCTERAPAHGHPCIGCEEPDTGLPESEHE